MNGYSIQFRAASNAKKMRMDVKTRKKASVLQAYELHTEEVELRRWQHIAMTWKGGDQWDFKVV